MATFLQICQKVAAESGTISGTQPTSVCGQVGRLSKVVGWVADAWTEIQNREASWRWMRVPFPASALAIANSASYTPVAWNITDFAEWLVTDQGLSIYATALGVADETPIKFISWDGYWRIYTRGVQTPSRPMYYSISPQNALVLAPIPDQAYQVRGEYRQVPQTLTNNTDVPACPPRFHDAIVWAAVARLCQHDEASPVALASAQYKFNEFLGGLERDQLPTFEPFVKPLA